jgi:hypothetical protein
MTLAELWAIIGPWLPYGIMAATAIVHRVFKRETPILTWLGKLLAPPGPDSHAPGTSPTSPSPDLDNHPIIKAILDRLRKGPTPKPPTALDELVLEVKRQGLGVPKLEAAARG